MQWGRRTAARCGGGTGDFTPRPPAIGLWGEGGEKQHGPPPRFSRKRCGEVNSAAQNIPVRCAALRSRTWHRRTAPRGTAATWARPHAAPQHRWAREGAGNGPTGTRRRAGTGGGGGAGGHVRPAALTWHLSAGTRDVLGSRWPRAVTWGWGGDGTRRGEPWERSCWLWGHPGRASPCVPMSPRGAGTSPARGAPQCSSCLPFPPHPGAPWPRCGRVSPRREQHRAR